MKRGGKSLLILVFTIMLLSFIKIGLADLFTVITQGDFDNGTYVNTEYNSSGFVQLSPGNLTGNYTSKVFNATLYTTWNNLSWIEGMPYGEELPANGVTETELGGVNMAGCVLLMHFNESSGEILDYSGRDNNGTISGIVTYSEPGRIGTALDFNHTLASGAVEIPYSDSLNITEELTAEFWFKRKTTDNFTLNQKEVFVRRGNYLNLAFGGDWHIFGLDDTGQIRFGVKTSTTQNLDTNKIFDDLNWHHLVATYNSSHNLNLYVDGVLDNSVAHSNAAPIQGKNVNTTIGSLVASTYSPNATMDEVAIYNRTLSAAEILDRYKRGITRLNVTVKSCDDDACSGETWNKTFTDSPANLSTAQNQYFQYFFDFYTENLTYLPELYNTTLDYISLPNFTAMDLMGRPTNTSIAVNLITGHENVSAYLEYGTTSGDPGSYSDTTSIQSVENDSLLEFDITGLDPDTQYYYRLRAKRTADSGYVATSERTFRTRRDSYPFNFTLITDSHVLSSTPSRATNLRQLLVNSSKNDYSDFIMYLGDMFEPTESNGEFLEATANAYYTLLRQQLSSSINYSTFYVIGNHEGESGWYSASNRTAAITSRKKFIPNPLNTTYEEGGSANEDYYAFTWGNTLFVVLNVMTHTTTNPVGTSVENWHLGTDQLNWFNGTLQTSTEPWKFVFIHHPVGGNGSSSMWSNYGRGGGRAAYVGEQATVHQMMMDDGVQAFFYGHDHLFADIVVDKVHYIDAGKGGHDQAFDAQGVYTKNFTDVGRTRVEILSDEIAKIYYVNLSGNIIANLTIDGMAPRINVVSPSNDSEDADGNITFTFNVTDASEIQNCTIFLNSVLNQTNASMVKDFNTNFTINNLADGTYTWYINCTDYNYSSDSDYTVMGGNYTPNMNTTGTMTFTVGESGGTTTTTTTGGTVTSGVGYEGQPSASSNKGPNSFLVDYNYLEERELELELGDTIEFSWGDVTLEITIENTESIEVDLNEDSAYDVLITFSEQDGKIIATLSKLEIDLDKELDETENITINKYLKPTIIVLISIGVLIVGSAMFSIFRFKNKKSRRKSK